MGMGPGIRVYSLILQETNINNLVLSLNEEQCVG